VNDDRARDALDLAERALDTAMRGGVTEAEAPVIAEDEALTRFANSQIHQNVAEIDVTVNLRVVIGKRVGVASSGRTDAEGLRRLAENATAIARVVEELEDWAGLPGPTAVTPAAAGFASSTAAASPELRADAVRQVIAAADDAGVTAYGSFSSGTETTAIANSAGVRVGGTRTIAQLLTVSMGPEGGSGYAEQAAVDIDAIDASAAVIRRYRIPDVRYGARELARIIARAAEQVRNGAAALEKRTGVHVVTVEINRLENEADEIHDEALRRLFEEERDALTVMKWKEVLDLLEDATDRCEDVANVFEGVVVKHG
jgi:predicted Zn-dependent protease